MSALTSEQHKALAIADLCKVVTEILQELKPLITEAVKEYREKGRR